MSSKAKRYARHPDFIFRKIVDEMVLVPIHQDVADFDCIYSLNPLGAFIWGQMEAPATQAELEDAILAEFDAPLDTIRQDLAAFLGEMVALGALREED